MKKLIYMLSAVIVLSIFPGCSQNATAGSWAFRAINWHNVVYRVTDQKVDKVGSLLGKIKYSSANETDDKGDGFSNYYKVGMELYSVPGVKQTDAIAVKDGDDYIKAVNAEK